MKILFIGQRGILGDAKDTLSISEQRVERLARFWASEGHEVSVICTSPFTPKHLRSFMNIRLLHYPSIDPEQPGGILPLLGGLWTLWKQQPQVAHMHGWKSAALVRLAVLLSPETTFIWTIDHLPNKLAAVSRFIAWQAKAAFDAISSPSRQLQYWLRQLYSLDTLYIPDGYTPSALPNIPAKHFKLRAKQYFFTTATDPADIKRVALAYKKAGKRSKLVFTIDEQFHYSKLLAQYPFLFALSPIQGRALLSVIKQAAGIIVAGTATSSDSLLHAMEAGRHMIAENDPFYEEVLGVTARFYAPKDKEELAKLIKSLRSTNNLKAQRRARAHFEWCKLTPRYLALYNLPVLRRIPLDSVRRASLPELSI
jgi:hypothetical protein